MAFIAGLALAVAGFIMMGDAYDASGSVSFSDDQTVIAFILLLVGVSIVVIDDWVDKFTDK